MGRAEDAERLKLLSARIAALRDELAGLRAERDAVAARLRALPGASGTNGRMAVKVDYGADGEGLFLADLPPKRVAVPERGQVPAPTKASAVDPDVEDR